MTAGVHMLAGAVIGSYFLETGLSYRKSIILIALFSILSHFLLDAMPHQDMPFHFPPTLFDLEINTIDVLASIRVIHLLFKKKAQGRTLWVGPFCAILPDLEFLTKTFLFGKNPLSWFDRFHENIQHHLISYWPNYFSDFQSHVWIMSYLLVGTIILAVEIYYIQPKTKIGELRICQLPISIPGR